MEGTVRRLSVYVCFRPNKAPFFRDFFALLLLVLQVGRGFGAFNKRQLGRNIESILTSPCDIGRDGAERSVFRRLFVG
ncbi:hypothetical protein FB45DRAFT_418891 [Roridomyces roridus]|uniref:Uncharacterized protein n=1 Tax=Roridomyces roridus TaxID=1738132 RepID=A0AAD7C4U5_9AGAR|nr:hypothetical protein FB45DRAFT_418891 [Roridomyces roridus]